MTTQVSRTPAGLAPPSPETRPHPLVLRAWEAVSTERHLQGVLEAVSDVVLPVVPFSAVGIVTFLEDRHDLYAMHLPGLPFHEGETVAEFARRPEFAARTKIDYPTRPLVPYDPGSRAEWEAGTPYNVPDLYAKDGWFEHEFHLAAGGVRAYCSVPLLVSHRMIGCAVFSRLEPAAYTADELRILCDVSRALAVAVANATANEQIRKLRDQLEAENIALREQLNQAPWFEDILGDSMPIRGVLDTVEQVAATDATVLLTGETGTGKELIARAIHRRSPRAHGPLIKVNCSAIPETLLASELFGHERGAFTGAAERRKGRFEQAHGGTLFLDEIGEMPPETQVMLLRVLQEREFERLGGSQTVQVDVRIVVATNRDLMEQVRAGRFRNDLYYRLSVFPVHLPPLRDRRPDIPLLAAHFAKKYSERFGRPVPRIGGQAISILMAHAWPGNVRELENVIERAVILSRNGELKIDRADVADAAPLPGNIDVELQGRERDAIEMALRASRGRIAGANGAARRLGMPASTLEFRIKRLGIDKFRFRKD